MNNEFLTYLKSIGMTDTLIQQVEKIYGFYKGVCKEEIADIFVTDFIKEDGSREYENLWFFSKNYMMEAKGFVSREDLDMTPMHKHISYWTVEKQDYDFKKATDKSRLHIEMNLDLRMHGDFKASKENCDFLKELFQKYILANLID